MISVDVKSAISEASKQTGVSESILTGFAQIESNFDVNAKSQTGVYGLFQITQNTWKEIWAREGQKNIPYSLNPRLQALTAAHYIKWLAPQFQFDQNLIAIAYNAGPGVAKDLLGKPLNEQNIKQAIAKHYRNELVESKTSETSNYPIKLAAALGKEFKIGPGSSNVGELTGTASSLSVSKPVPTAEIADKDKPFFQSLTASCRNEIFNLNNVISKLDYGILRAKMSHSKLSPLIKNTEDLKSTSNLHR